ncbi:MAG: hypothetical protein KJO00_10245 [Bacteroidia bacterium]|nr:hypothetical protein [Bacteroidia bacterium]
MAHIFKNEILEIHIDSPDEGYNFSRFDWTGKIGTVKFKNAFLTVTEKIDGRAEHLYGKGFCNEFGIDNALGFDDAKNGDWFHKIGIGLLRKNGDVYDFNNTYEIKPARFKTTVESEKLIIECFSDDYNGYSYVLKKEISINKNKFSIKYLLKNTGEKDIVTDEYNHNFMAMDKELMGPDYKMRFSFQLKPGQFGEAVNPEQKIVMGPDMLTFNGTPEEQFFYSNISGDELVDPEWELINLRNKLRIRESVSFQTNKINLWGWKHVICPELFIRLSINPGQSAEWSRYYTIDSF